MADKVALITGTDNWVGWCLLVGVAALEGLHCPWHQRRSSSLNTARVDHLYQDPHGNAVRLLLHYGDMTELTNLIRIIQEVQPTEIYTGGPEPCARLV